MVIMSLLYPNEVSSTDIARIAGPKHDSAWRVEFESGGTIFRVSRSFSPSSMVLDVQDAHGAFQRDAAGAGNVRKRLAELVKLPAPSVMESLNFWTNTNPITPAKPDESLLELDNEDPGQIEMVGTDDYFGNLMASGQADKPASMSDEERRVVSDEFRKTRTIEFVEDQLKHANAKLDDLIDRLGTIVDSSGETARISRELSNLPEMRELTQSEAELLTDPEGTVAEIERKILQIDEAIDSAQKTDDGRAPMLLANPVFVVGVVGTIILTVLSFIGEPSNRRFALGNIATLGLALAGVFNWLGTRENTGKSGRKLQTMARRREQLVVQDKHTRATVARLREELPVENTHEYRVARGRRRELERRLAEIQKQHEAAFETEEYKKLDGRKERAETRLNTLKLARRRLGDSPVSSYELEQTLERAGLDPAVILWRPDTSMVELKRQVKRLGQVASKYRLISEDGLNPKTVSSWLRVAERILGEEVPILNMTPDHQMVTEEGQSAFELLDVDRATAIVQALRMSLHLTLLKANAPGIHGFAIDVHPERIGDTKIRKRLSKMYTGLGERLQVVVTTDP
ncbi:MAG: hypothetical protein ACJAYU_004523 [Bradymonadia bacterium]|jgi:hypothetical protein